MDMLFSVFFGAGVAAWTYSKMGRRVGYGNTQNQITLVLVVFVLTSLFFFTILKYILNV
jgi:hypothetical protein